MRTPGLRLAAGLIAVLLAFGTAGASAARTPAHGACDEACLKGFMDGYLDALARHDPSLVPVAAHYRYTENAAQIRLGEALWKTFNAWGPYRHDVYDVTTGGAASFLSLTENHQIPFDDLMQVRLKIVGRRITEIETVVSRHAAGAKNLPAREPTWNQIMQRQEPAATRLTRAQLIAGATAYLNALAYANGALAPFAESCIRLENGNVTAIGPNDPPPVPISSGPPGQADINTLPAEERPQLLGTGCGKQLAFKSYSFITGYEDAHFPVVDVKRQIVFATFNFMRRGDVESWSYNGHTFPMQVGMRYPNEMLNTEYFKFVGGKISRVEAVFSGPQAYGLGTGWPGGTGQVSRPDGQ